MDWPNDADGDVFRRLQSEGFDFSVRHKIDFQIDFNSWPPASEAISRLRGDSENIALHEPENEFQGYVELSVFDYLSYELVMKLQTNISQLVASYGGTCNSWGVLHSGTAH